MTARGVERRQVFGEHLHLLLHDGATDVCEGVCGMAFGEGELGLGCREISSVGWSLRINRVELSHQISFGRGVQTATHDPQCSSIKPKHCSFGDTP